ncbi:hypothetical protein MMC07_004234 [Pseudocyphellaria aurata]|nr:hypothetical protein [Pseudocyphellaria aurata]
MRASNFYDDASPRAAKKSCVMILAYLIVSSITIAAEETCYFPNGVIAKNTQDDSSYYPCHEGNSTCCALNEGCIRIEAAARTRNGLDVRSNTATIFTRVYPLTYGNVLGVVQLQQKIMSIGWWCGKDSASACQVGPDASTFSVDGGMLRTVIKAPASTSLTTTSTSSTTAIESPPLTITATETAAVGNGGSGESSKSSKVSVAVGAGVGIPLVAAALGFLGISIWRELRKRRRGDKVVPESTQQEHSPTSGATTIQQSSPGELTGHMVERELVAPAPVHEMYSRPGPGPSTP